MGRIRNLVTVVLIVAMVTENSQVIRANTFYRQIPENVLSMTTLFDSDVPKKDDGFQFNLYYDLAGGLNSPLNPELYDITQLPLTLMIPSRDGYDFAGWYTDAEYENKITSITERNCDNYMLYAKWTKKVESDNNVKYYSYSTNSVLNRSTKKLSSCDYEFLDNVKIPGMPSTREMDLISKKISGESQCPQGICITPDYILVSAYCSQWGRTGSLHVFDRESGEYLVTMGMKSSSHLGGVTYDGENVWICHSDNQTLERVSYQFIQLLAEMKLKKSVDCTDSIDECRVENRPSCVTYYDGHIWVATQTAFFKSVLFSYVYEDGRLVADGSYRIPDKVQGIAFSSSGKVYLSTSLGRTNSSYLKIYDSLQMLDSKPAMPSKKVEMPPCSEEIEIADGKLYVLFESAGLKYFEGTDGKGKSSSPIDEILTIQLASL